MNDDHAALIVRGQEEPNPADPGPDDRSIEELLRVGAIILDKPIGPTSHQAVAWLRDIVGASKVAHSGTLDPHVSGLLVCTLDRATKAIDMLRGGDKTYVTIMELHESVPLDRVREVLGEFQGRIYQRPPGKAAVRRQLRKRRITSIRIADVEPDADVRRVLMQVDCEAGTYIRKLCIDAGLVMGVRAHMAELRRTGVGTIDETAAVTLHDVKDAYDHWTETGEEDWLREVVIPIETLLAGVPRIIVRGSAVDAVCHGAPLHVPGVLAVDDRVRAGMRVLMATQQGTAIAVGTAEADANSLVEAREGVAAKPDSVLMEAGTYERGW